MKRDKITFHVTPWIYGAPEDKRAIHLRHQFWFVKVRELYYRGRNFL